MAWIIGSATGTKHRHRFENCKRPHTRPFFCELVRASLDRQLAQHLRILDHRLLATEGRAVQTCGWIGFEPVQYRGLGAALVEGNRYPLSADGAERETRLTELRVERLQHASGDELARRAGRRHLQVIRSWFGRGPRARRDDIGKSH